MCLSVCRSVGLSTQTLSSLQPLLPEFMDTALEDNTLLNLIELRKVSGCSRSVCLSVGLSVRPSVRLSVWSCLV